MRWLIVAVALYATPAFACDGLYLNLGFGYDTKHTFDQTASSFQLEWCQPITKRVGYFVSYDHHSTLQTGWPFGGKDKNTSDIIAAGVRIKLF